MRFIYVTRKEDKDKMVAMSFKLLSEDKRNHAWVFENKDTTSFAYEDELTNADVSFVLSNTLLF